MNKNAAIVIGDDNIIKLNSDIYYYPNNITEYELMKEIIDLNKFYDKIYCLGEWPVHIRKEKIKSWIIGL